MFLHKVTAASKIKNCLISNTIVLLHLRAWSDREYRI